MATSLKGVNTVVAVRRLSEAKTKAAYVLPFQTDGDYSRSRDTDSNTTKSGTLSSSKGLKTELSFTVYDSDDPVLEVLSDSMDNGTTLEFWRIKLDKKNEKGWFYADYMRGEISKDDQSSDPEKDAERKFEVNVSGKAQSGYTDLPHDVKEELSYVFRGAGIFDESNNGNGEALDASKIETPQSKGASSTQPSPETTTD